MTEGPLGGPRPFASDTKTVIILAGVDGPEPPVDVLMSTQQVIEDTMNKSLGLKVGTLDVSVTTNPHPSREQKEALGNKTLHVEQYDIETPWEEITQEHINGVHNEVISKLKELGYNITETKTTVV